MEFDLLLWSWSLLLLFLHVCLFKCSPCRSVALLRERGSAACSARRHLLHSNSTSSLQTSQHKAARIPTMDKILLHPRYLSHSGGKQIEFLSSYHFNSCQKGEHQRFSPTHCHVVSTSARPSDTLPRETQLL